MSPTPIHSVVAKVESGPEMHTITVDALFKHFNNWVEKNGLHKDKRHSGTKFVRNSFHSDVSPLRKTKGFLSPGPKTKDGLWTYAIRPGKLLAYVKNPGPQSIPPAKRVLAQPTS